MAITKIQSESMNLADTYAFTGTVTGAGGVNTPAFEAYLSSTQSPSDNSWTKIQINTEVFDTASAYDNSSNYRFTVPSGQSGKYFVYGMAQLYGTYDANDISRLSIYKNGSSIGPNIQGYHDHYGSIQISCLENLSVSDYIEVYAYHNAGGSINTLGTSKFLGYRIIE